jgi:hypothetical protein
MTIVLELTAFLQTWIQGTNYLELSLYSVIPRLVNNSWIPRDVMPVYRVMSLGAASLRRCNFSRPTNLQFARNYTYFQVWAEVGLMMPNP